MNIKLNIQYQPHAGEFPFEWTAETDETLKSGSEATESDAKAALKLAVNTIIDETL